jgi:hypothetical protein
LALVILLLLVLLSRHYLFRHHVLGNLRKAFRMIKQEEEAELPPPPIIPTVLPPGTSDHRIPPQSPIMDAIEPTASQGSKNGLDDLYN